MGLSHYAILGAHPKVEVVAICDNAAYLTSILRKYNGVETFKDYRKMFDSVKLDLAIIATPTATHLEAAKAAMERGIHLFVEKPLALDPSDSKLLSDLALSKNLVNQVGYHNRFIGTFKEAKRLLAANALGDVYHISGSAFGQVVIRPKSGGTWRSKKSEGGGCLHDYASHVVDLMNFLVGPPDRIISSSLQNIFSKDVEDAVYATFHYPDGSSGSLETNWSDETYRKMSTTITISGKKGKIIVDRQECRVFLQAGTQYKNYPSGWTIRYITDLQASVDFYLRGEEYSAQLDEFITAVESSSVANENSFASAYETDRVINMIMQASHE